VCPRLAPPPGRAGGFALFSPPPPPAPDPMRLLGPLFISLLCFLSPALINTAVVVIYEYQDACILDIRAGDDKRGCLALIPVFVNCGRSLTDDACLVTCALVGGCRVTVCRRRALSLVIGSLPAPRCRTGMGLAGRRRRLHKWPAAPGKGTTRYAWVPSLHDV